MSDWTVDVQTVHALAAFPRLMQVAYQVRAQHSRYRHRGRDRQQEKHCLLKISLSGEGNFRDAAGDHRLPAGRCFLCHICDQATEYFYPPGGRQPWSFVYVCFIGDPAIAMLRDFVARYGPVHDLPLDRGLVPELLAWKRLAGKVQVMSPGEGARVVATIFASLFEAAQVADPGQGELIRRAIHMAGANVERSLAVGDLARLLGIGREHLTRSFLRAGLPPPHRYLERKRMVEACRRLKSGSEPVYAIAAGLGYTQAPHFCRTFQRIIGMTPKRFRAEGVVPVE
ncbi:AraC family transcriptional regulator [Planctomycetota bacterium]|nr:AraC family transcriptional regulator [Planctomycetota bacterium]